MFLLFDGVCLFETQLHGDMCKELSGVLCKVLSIFPSLEGARPRSKSGIQALCSLHIALEKAKNILQHCSESSKLYLVRLFLFSLYSLLSLFGRALRILFFFFCVCVLISFNILLHSPIQTGHYRGCCPFKV